MKKPRWTKFGIQILGLQGIDKKSSVVCACRVCAESRDVRAKTQMQKLHLQSLLTLRSEILLQPSLNKRHLDARATLF
jgi:hypothetical protein